MSTLSERSARTGAQAVERAILILKILASVRRQGLRLIDIERRAALTRPTAHRLLATLTEHKLVERDPVTRRYYIGIELRFLANAAPEVSPRLLAIADKPMRRLAEETGDTVFLMVRLGMDVVCVDRQTGHYPIKALTGEVGTRRPLGVGASGLVLLACLPEGEQDEAIRTVRTSLDDYPGISEPVLRVAVKEARSRGYAYSDGHVISEVRGLGVPIMGKSGPIAALSLAAIRGRIPPDRVDELVDALQRARETIEMQIAERAPELL